MVHINVQTLQEEQYGACNTQHNVDLENAYDVETNIGGLYSTWKSLLMKKH